MIETNHIYNIDCLEGLKQLPDKSVDFTITDPPYNVGKNYGSDVDDKRADYFEWCKLWFSEVERVTISSIVFTCGPSNLSDWCSYKKPLYIAVWYKPNAMPKTYGPKRGFFSVWEPILIYNAIPPRLLKIRIHDVLKVPISVQKDVDNHPTPRSRKLWERIVNSFTEENNLILDPFLGSGTTAVACKKLRRNFIGFEINPDYVKIANDRLSHTHPQQKSFGGFFS